MVNGQRHERNMVVLPDRILSDWGPADFDDLSAEHFEQLAGLGSEIVLLGTGRKLRFPRTELLRVAARTGLGLEVMDMQAACRTYNILVAEARKVAAALLIESD